MDQLLNIKRKFHFLDDNKMISHANENDLCSEKDRGSKLQYNIIAPGLDADRIKVSYDSESLNVQYSYSGKEPLCILKKFDKTFYFEPEKKIKSANCSYSKGILQVELNYEYYEMPDYNRIKVKVEEF